MATAGGIPALAKSTPALFGNKPTVAGPPLVNVKAGPPLAGAGNFAATQPISVKAGPPLAGGLAATTSAGVKPAAQTADGARLLSMLASSPKAAAPPPGVGGA